MDSEQFEARMRDFEIFHGLRVPPETYAVLRVDGKAFHTVTKDMEHPYDNRFHKLMLNVAAVLTTQLDGLYCHTHSDEASVVLPIDSALFGRSVEKLVSISAAAATAAFNAAEFDNLEKELLHPLAMFDSRVVVLPNVQAVVDYYSWRQADCARNCINDWVYWTLRKEGNSATAATDALHRISTKFKHDVLEARGINFAKLAGWQKNGSAIVQAVYQKNGVDPRDGSVHPTFRSRLQVLEHGLPTGDTYRAFVRDQVDEPSPAPYDLEPAGVSQ